MAGALFFLILAVGVVFLVVLSLVSWFWALGVLVVGALGWLAIGGFGAIFGVRSSQDPNSAARSLPTTQDAAYDPVDEPVVG